MRWPRGGRIAGTVTASAGGAPLTSVGLQVYSSTGIPATEGFTDDTGEYVTLAGLPSGTYYLRAEDFDRQYLSEIYDNIPCVGCDAPEVLAAGTPIVVTAGATASGRNFQLARGGSISGRVVSAASGTGVGGVQVRAQGEGGAFGSDNTDVDGNYTIDGLPAGQYVMWTLQAPAHGLVDEIYDDIPCVSFCDDTTVRFIGAKVAVAVATTTPNINFALAAGGSATGSVTDSGTNAPIAGVTVSVATVTGGALATERRRDRPMPPAPSP